MYEQNEELIELEYQYNTNYSVLQHFIFFLNFKRVCFIFLNFSTMLKKGNLKISNVKSIVLEVPAIYLKARCHAPLVYIKIQPDKKKRFLTQYP